PARAALSVRLPDPSPHPGLAQVEVRRDLAAGPGPALAQLHDLVLELRCERAAAPGLLPHALHDRTSFRGRTPDDGCPSKRVRPSFVVSPAVASERDLRALAAIVSQDRPDLTDGEGLPPSLLADLMGQIRCDAISLTRGDG